MLAKKFGPDVREGKRRQFNYIGGLLRKVQPDLMEAILQATKDGEMDKFHTLPGSDKESMDESVELDGNDIEEEEEMDEEVLVECEETAKRWLEGLILGDSSITKEVFSIYNVDFDRKELRKLVREVCAKQEYKLPEESSTKIEVDTALSQANKSLYNFLFLLAKQNHVAGY
ncbi:uncharacterized protein LOC131046277 isoform X1 [Cryptomeria japonica]|uniref:uncharacterized protein LOC131046277 isoform X1 n=1 Tax=Cryptomeria japonica TaxID=3369 RepID=UPI0025ACC6D2|nr:uncharacterized protein LOC131046277 isoform X1 [Cryptomeria japonica]